MYELQRTNFSVQLIPTLAGSSSVGEDELVKDTNRIIVTPESHALEFVAELLLGSKVHVLHTL